MHERLACVLLRLQSGGDKLLMQMVSFSRGDRWPARSGIMRRPLAPLLSRPNPTGPRRCGGPRHFR